jgi:hypothetical protein
MKKALFAAAVVVALLFTGCEALGIGVDSFVGTWKLTSVAYGGVSIDAAKYGLTETIVAKSDKTWTVTATSGGETTTGSGTWSKSDSTYTLTDSSKTSISGTLSSDKKTFTITESGISMVFTKS